MREQSPCPARHAWDVQGCISGHRGAPASARSACAHRVVPRSQRPPDHGGNRRRREPCPGWTRRRLLVIRRADGLVQDRLGFGEGCYGRGPLTAPVVQGAREGLTDQHGRRRLHGPAPAGAEAALPNRQLRDPLALGHDSVQRQGQLTNLFGCHRRTSRETFSSSRLTQDHGERSIGVVDAGEVSSWAGPGSGSGGGVPAAPGGLRRGGDWPAVCP